MKICLKLKKTLSPYNIYMLRAELIFDEHTLIVNN